MWFRGDDQFELFRITSLQLNKDQEGKNEQPIAFRSLSSCIRQHQSTYSCKSFSHAWWE